MSYTYSDKYSYLIDVLGYRHQELREMSNKQVDSLINEHYAEFVAFTN